MKKNIFTLIVCLLLVVQAAPLFAQYGPNSGAPYITLLTERLGGKYSDFDSFVRDKSYTFTLKKNLGEGKIQYFYSMNYVPGYSDGSTYYKEVINCIVLEDSVTEIGFETYATDLATFYKTQLEMNGFKSEKCYEELKDNELMTCYAKFTAPNSWTQYLVKFKDSIVKKEKGQDNVYSMRIYFGGILPSKKEKGCIGYDKKIEESKLVGKWQRSEDAIISFKADHTYTWTDLTNDGVENGKWNLKGNILYLDDTAWKVCDFNSQEFTYSYENSTTQIVTRVKTK